MVYQIWYYDARTGRRRADFDPNAGDTYLYNLAREGGSPGEIAVAQCVSQTDIPNQYLLPGSHEWTREEPPILRGR